MPSMAFQLVFSIASLSLGAIIFTLNCQRFLCTSRRSYDLNKQRSIYDEDDENELRRVIYFGHEDLDVGQSGSVTPQIVVEPAEHDEGDSGIVMRPSHRRKSSFGHILDDPRVESQELNACASSPSERPLSTHSRTSSIDLVVQKHLVVEIEDINGRPRSLTDSYGRQTPDRPRIRMDNLHDLKDLDEDTHSVTSSVGNRVEYLKRELNLEARSRSGSLGRRVDQIKESEAGAISRRRSGSFDKQDRPRSLGSRKRSFHVIDSSSIDDVIDDNPNEDCRIEYSEHDSIDVCLMSSVL